MQLQQVQLSYAVQDDIGAATFNAPKLFEVFVTECESGASDDIRFLTTRVLPCLACVPHRIKCRMCKSTRLVNAVLAASGKQGRMDDIIAATVLTVMKNLARAPESKATKSNRVGRGVQRFEFLGGALEVENDRKCIEQYID